jgi:uncharacterized protein
LTIPVYVVSAAEEGPRVFLTGALHGDELNGMGIIRELLFTHPPALKKGALIMVPVVNLSGLERHSRYMPDRRDPNRCFPGAADGSLTSRLVHAIYTEIIQQSHYGIDFHSAAVRRTNFPNIRANLEDEETRMLAEAFGCEVIVNTKGPAGSLRRTAVESGVPAIVLEAGEVWKIEPGVVDIGVRGCLNVLKKLGMIDGAVKAPAFQAIVKRTTWVRSTRGGILSFYSRPGDLVRKNDCLAMVFSISGREETELLSPVDGIVLGMSTMPVIKPGGPVYHMAVLPRRRWKTVKEAIGKRPRSSLYARLQDELATNITIQEN